MAIKVSLPAPPAPSFEQSSSRVSAQRTKRISPFGLELFAQVQRTSLWFGALMAAWFGLATGSHLVALSFVLGGLVSMAMLKSQVWFVTSLVRPRSEGRPNANRMLWVVQPVKYLFLLAFIGGMLHLKMLDAAFFALGVSLTPFLVLAKGIGRALTFYARPISEVYGTPAFTQTQRAETEHR